ncbi:MAG: GntR family transcriptional regulator [Synergistales bacterium]|nr:GntR family transcriptional regulator [Synergistales bacterium]
MTAGLERQLGHKSLGQRVAAEIRRRLLVERRYRHGQHVMESEIAAELHISRAPVREALRELVKEGLLVSIPRKGIFVPHFDRDDMAELVDIRYMLECRVYDELIEGGRLGASELERAETLIGDLVEVVRSDGREHDLMIAFSQKDMAFHSYLWELSDRN